MTLSMLILTVVAALGFAFAPQLIALFRDDPQVIACGTWALRFQCLTFPMQSWIITSNMLQQAIGRTGPATFNSTARQGLFFIPAVLILSALLGVTGLQMAQAVADAITLVISIPIQIHVLKTLEK